MFCKRVGGEGERDRDRQRERHIERHIERKGGTPTGRQKRQTEKKERQR